MTAEYSAEQVKKGAAENCYWRNGCVPGTPCCTYCIGFHAGVNTGIKLAKEAAEAQVGLAVGFPEDYDGSRRLQWTTGRMLRAISDLLKALKR